jgi:hypothetical protein
MLTLYGVSVTAENARHIVASLFEMGTLSLEDALQLVLLYAEAEDDNFDKAAVRWLGRLLLERPMTLAVTAHSVELVSQLRGPGAGWSAGALETLARPASLQHGLAGSARRDSENGQ